MLRKERNCAMGQETGSHAATTGGIRKIYAQLLVRIKWSASADCTRVVKQVVVAVWRFANTAFRILEKKEKEKKKVLVRHP